jgi:hypothetical protein
LGWSASTLAPLRANQLDDTQVTCPLLAHQYFLVVNLDVGLRIPGTGPQLYFSTGNSDPAKSSYDGKTNIQESVVKLSRE